MPHENLDLFAPQAAPITLGDLCERYVLHCRGRYTKYGRVTRTFNQVQAVTEILRHYLPSHLPIGCLGPKLLGRWRRWLASHPEQRWSRATVGEYVRVVVAMFTWAVSEELTDAAHVAALKSLEPLRRGRSVVAGGKPMRDGGRVVGVPDDVLARIIEHASPLIGDMIRLQALTGMRPCELVALRGCDLHIGDQPDELEYRVAPDVNKTDHGGQERGVPIGPRGIEILRRWATANMTSPIFQPSRALELDRQRKRAARATPLWESHDLKVRARRRRAKGIKPLKVGDRYTTDSYRRAIARACDRAGLPRIAPNQIRHAAATKICSSHGLEVAKILLGHTDLKTTLRYVDAPKRAAADAVKKFG